jgi:hypothetical protein
MLFQLRRHQPSCNFNKLSSSLTQAKHRHDSVTSTIQYWLNQQRRPLTMHSFLKTYFAKGKSHVHTLQYTLQPSKRVRNSTVYGAAKNTRYTHSFSSHSNSLRSNHRMQMETEKWGTITVIPGNVNVRKETRTPCVRQPRQTDVVEKLPIQNGDGETSLHVQHQRLVRHSGTCDRYSGAEKRIRGLVGNTEE